MKYKKNINMTNCHISAPKTFRRSEGIFLKDCCLPNALETMWNCKNIKLENVNAQGDYFGLNVDGAELKFTDDAISEIARISEEMNMTSEDIGARRLHTVMENLLEDVSFEADGTSKEVVIDKAFVQSKLGVEAKTKDLKKYIL